MKVEVLVAIITAGFSVIIALISAAYSHSSAKKLKRIERLEKSRHTGYGKIWGITSDLNLFGPSRNIEPQKLSRKLTTWYFEDGWVLSEKSKDQYFIIQWILNFATIKNIKLSRPVGDSLYGSDESPKQVLKNLRVEMLNLPVNHTMWDFSNAEFLKHVKQWLHDFDTEKASKKSYLKRKGNEAWLLAQFALSRFRTTVVEEIDGKVN